MDKKNLELERGCDHADRREWDAIDDMVEFQNNQFNPGALISKGKYPFFGNSSPIGKVLLCFFFAIIWGVPAIAMLVNVEYLNTISIVVMATLGALGTIFVVMGFINIAKIRRAKSYERYDDCENISCESEILSREKICPKCDNNHDLDYPKCPKCEHIYMQK